MMKYSPEHLCRQVLPIVEQTAVFIRGELGKVQQSAIEEKALNSLVSYVDQEAEQSLVKGLSTLLPEAVYLTEEATTEQALGDWRWIIDPLDGTTNFLFQLPHFAVSVALEHKGEAVVGVVYDVMRSECFYAWAGGGAWLNGQQIYCRANDQLADSLLATGFPYYDYERMTGYLEAFAFLMQNTRGIRRWGAAALDLAFTACGRFDGFFEYSLNAWDIAAGILLVREAGGVVTDFQGENRSLANGEIVAASSSIHSDLLAIVQKSMQP